MGDDKGASLNPRTQHYEFLGPLGALFITLTVPATVYGLYFGCSETSGGCPPRLDLILPKLSSSLSDPNWWKSLWDTKAFVIYNAWYAFCVAAWLIVPGDWVEGVLMRNGQKKKYKINAFATLLLALGFASGIILRFGPHYFTFFYERWTGFVTVSLLMATFQAVACYVASYCGNKLLALGGNTGNFIYDFFIGRELNPSVGSLDIKSFNELRPGLILWVLVDISMACEQAVRRGGPITDSMWLVLAFHLLYVADALYYEPAVLTTMDITTDGFGFMLAVGDLVWVPFTYSLQARYLAFNDVELGPVKTALILTLNALGYWIFRASNAQKNNFRNGRHVEGIKYIETERGSKLITSHWWGWSRHPNYFGDLLMAWAWCLPTGFNTPITYFYPIYFTVLLLHRQRRDDENCEKKYGKDWQKYKGIVPWRIVPYVY